MPEATHGLSHLSPHWYIEDTLITPQPARILGAMCQELGEKDSVSGARNIVVNERQVPTMKAFTGHSS